MKHQKAEEVRAAPGDTSFEDLTRRLLAVPKGELVKLEEKAEVHKRAAKAA